MEQFSTAMALTDLLPVGLFCAGGAVAFTRLQSVPFGAGVLLAALAGVCKAGWKLVAAFRHRDVPLLRRLFRVLMPCGFLAMILSVPLAPAAWLALAAAAVRLPALIFLLAGCAGMVLMCVFAVKLDRADPQANWTEQLTNTAAQAMFLIALLLA